MRKPKAIVGLLASIIVCMGLATPAAHAAGTSRVELPCVKSGEGATGPHAKDFCWIDWSNLPLRDGTTPVSITVDGGRIDADVTLSHSANSVLYVNDYSTSKQEWSKLIPAYKLTGNTALGFRATQLVKANRDATVTFRNITAVPDMDAAGMNVLKDFQMAFGDAETMSTEYDGSWEQTDITSDKPIAQLGWVGDTDPAHSYGKANTGWDTTHVTLAGGSVQPDGNGAHPSHGALVAGATEPSTFTVDFSQHESGSGDSAIAVGIYMPYTTAYPKRDGYTFTGWTLDGKPYDFATPVTKDITLAANWTRVDQPAVTHTVSFDAGDGTPIGAQTVEDGHTAVRPTDPTRGGYRFDGWTLDGKPYDFTSPVVADITLTAAWSKTASTTGKPTTTPGLPATGAGVAWAYAIAALLAATGIIMLAIIRHRAK